MSDAVPQRWSYANQVASMSFNRRPSHTATVLRDNRNFQIVEPTQRGLYGLTFVALPALDPASPTPRLLIDPSTQQPFDRYSAMPDDFTPWVYPYLGVKRVGAPGSRLSFLFDDSIRSPDAEHTHPYEMVRQAAWAAHHKHKDNQVIQCAAYGNSLTEGWDKLVRSHTDGNRTVFTALPKPEVLHFIPALVYAVGDVDRDTNQPNDQLYFDSAPLGASLDDPLPIVMLTAATFRTLADRLNEFREGVGVVNDLSCLKWPRVTSSAFIHVFGLQQRNCPALANAQAERMSAFQRPSAPAGAPAATGWGARRVPSSNWRGADAESGKLGFGYDVFISVTGDGRSNGPRVPTEQVDRLAENRLRAPEQVFRFFSRDEVARALCQVGLPPGLLYHAFQSHKEWLPDEIRDGAVARYHPPVSTQSAASAGPAKPAEVPVPGSSSSVPAWLTPPSSSGATGPAANLFGSVPAPPVSPPAPPPVEPPPAPAPAPFPPESLPEPPPDLGDQIFPSGAPHDPNALAAARQAVLDAIAKNPANAALAAAAARAGLTGVIPPNPPGGGGSNPKS